LLALCYTPKGTPILAATLMMGAESVTVRLGPRAEEDATAAIVAATQWLVP
jgi:hypothetical protein